MKEPFDLNLRHLDAAVNIARSGSISSSVSVVNLSQPALTQAMAKLESLLGHQLFERRSGGARATMAGALFLIRAERALSHIVSHCRIMQRCARLSGLAFPERRITMVQLRAFWAVERAGSYALAARGMGLSQPSVHRAAKQLELILGAPLLVQVGRTLRATAAGETIARGLGLAFAELRAGLDDLAAVQLKGAGRIRIGSLPLPRAGLLPDALLAFSATHPNSEVFVIEGPYSELLPALRGGEIDLLLGALRPMQPGSDIVQRTLFEDDLYVVGRPGHPLSGQTPSANVLAGYPWVVATSGAPMRSIWEKMFANSDLPSVTLNCSSVLTTRGMLIGGDWLALLSPEQFKLEEAAGALIRIGDHVPASRRHIGLTTRADWRPTGAQADFLEMLDVAAASRS